MNYRKVFALLMILAGFTGLLFLKDATPIARLLCASLGMIWIIKVAALVWQTSDGTVLRSRLGILAFLSIWPGVSLAGFTERRSTPIERTGDQFRSAWISFLFGIAVLLLSSLVGKGGSTVGNYIALISILLIIHLGLVELIADGMRLLGFTPESLFERPFMADSLRDFWSFRWNRAFVDMNRIFLLNPLRNRISSSVLVFSIFVISGLLHEIGISYADGVSWGSPLLYFILQGLGMLLERRSKFPKFLVWAWIILPVPLLFTPAFTNLFVGDISRLIADTILVQSRNTWIHFGLVVGGLANLLVLCASIQVPGALRWKEDFAKLSSLNRKIFWTYGGYVFSIIVYMAAVSFFLANQSLDKMSGAAVLWLVFIALFWWARVFIDLFYMKNEDWPQVPLYKIGHICLTTLFVFLAALYTAMTLAEIGVPNT